MVEQATLVSFVQGLLSAPSAEQGPLHELLALSSETAGFPPQSYYDVLSEGNNATDALLAAFSPPANAPYPEKVTIVGKDDPVQLPKSVVEAIFRSVPIPSSVSQQDETSSQVPARSENKRRPTSQNILEQPINIDDDDDDIVDVSMTSVAPHDRGVIRRRGASQVDPESGRRSVYQHQAPSRRPYPSTPKQETQRGPFKTAQSQFLRDKRKRGGSSPPDTSRRDGGYAYGNNHNAINNRSTAHKDNSAHLRRPGANIRAMNNAVLGKRQRAGGGEAIRKEGTGDPTTNEDLPEIPNVDPKFVEMIMNEALEKSPGVEWDDISGLEFAKKCVKEAIIWPMQRPDIFKGLRAPPKGLLLFGPPGTGKTMIGRAIASKSGARFFNISASSLMSKWVGEGEKMVRALFGVARELQPAVIFIDEVDSLLTQRTEGDQECSRRIKTEFLVQMDGAGTSKEDRVLLVGATNRPQELDEAARRRLVKRLYIPLPDDEARKGMVKRLLRSDRHDLTEDKGDFDEIARLTKGYSGSDMAALGQEAAYGPVRELGEKINSIDESGLRPIGRGDFVDAAKQVRASVSNRDLDGYVEWNKTYGSFAIEGAPTRKEDAKLNLL